MVDKSLKRASFNGIFHDIKAVQIHICMAGFASALALAANEIQVEKHIELCYSLSRYSESHLTTIKAVHLHLWLVLHLR